MKLALRSFSTVLVLAVLAGCSTPDSRISGSQAAFNTWSPDVQAKVRAGRVDVGFTVDMVRVALGEPDRRSTRTTAEGTSEVWIYFDHNPHFSFGFGMGTASRHSAFGGGVVVGDNGFRDDEVLRVILSGDRVVAIESRR